MQTRFQARLARALRDPLWWHLLILFAVSAAYESLFLRHGLNRFDEGWPLYAAMRLHQGGVLYRDVFFSFPPGHLLPAWIGYALAPPGIVGARMLYAAFDVALVIALYFLGRRLMPARFALLGAALLAVAAPISHIRQLLFGYRYLVFAVLALLAFAKRLRTGDSRWMLLAGLLIGVALYFRQDPAFSASCALVLGSLAAERDWRRWIRDWTWLGGGIAIVIVPVLAWFAGTVGLQTLWHEVVVRILALQSLQSAPIPPLRLPEEWSRDAISNWFLAFQFRLYPLLYGAYAAVLLARWIRSLARREPFRDALLLAVVVFGSVYFPRALGRSDSSHLNSTLPPACLLLAHSLSLGAGALSRRRAAARRRSALADAAVALPAFALWVFLSGTDQYLDFELRGSVPFESLDGGITYRASWRHQSLDRKVKAIRESTRATDTILDLSASPIIYVLTGRAGPGYSDIVMPGTFLSAEEEQSFIERLEQSPPALVVWPMIPFDERPARSPIRTAPQLWRWVRERYEISGGPDAYMLMTPRRGG